MYYGYGFDPTYVFVIIAFLITMIASMNVKSTFSKYDKVLSRRGLTGAETVRKILDANGLYNIRIERVSGHLSDHYDPKNGVIRLSDATYNSTSVAAIGVAAHECGHAVQHQVGYVPIKVRNGIVPFVNICNYASFPLIMIGLLLGSRGYNLAMLGVILFCAVLVFQLVTLPTETNASRRALQTIEGMNLLDTEELHGAKKVLTAAAMTYVAAVASTALQVLRLFPVVQNSNRRRR